MRGYKDVWEAAVRKELCRKREPGNHQDPFTMAVVVRSAVTVNYILKKISSVYSMLLPLGCAIKCQVMASKHYSEDLPQGIQEIPCTLTFEGHAKPSPQCLWQRSLMMERRWQESALEVRQLLICGDCAKIAEERHGA